MYTNLPNYEEYYVDHQMDMYHEMMMPSGVPHHMPMMPMLPHMMDPMGEMMPHSMHHIGGNIPMEQELDQSQELPPSICWTGLDMANIGLRSVHENIGNFRHLTALYLSNNNLTSLPLAICNNLINLTHLDISCNRISAIPPQIEELQHLDIFLLKFNLVKELPPEIGRLWRLREIGTAGNPITSPPAQVLAQGASQIVAFFREKLRPIPLPQERGWISFPDGDYSRQTITPAITPVDPQKVRVMTYNVLSESYQEQHFYTPSWAINWDHRKKKILKELTKIDADLICLQEVEGKQYHEFFNAKMIEKGYTGYFQQKSRARTVDDWNSVDGCAIFYRSSKFRLVQERFYEFQSLSLNHINSVTDKRLHERIHGRDNIAVAVVLQPLFGGANNNSNNNSSNSNSGNNAAAKRQAGKQSSIPNRICVVNTHIHWDPSMPDVKVMQVQLLLDELQTLLTKEFKDLEMPLIIAGDFNSTPVSGVYDLLRNGAIAADHVDCKGFRYGKYTTEGYNHKFQLNSAYAPLGEPAFTNYNFDFMGVLDYIWFSEKSFRISGVLQPLSEEDILQQKSPLPNANFPSDHICLAADFEFISPSLSHHHHHLGNSSNNNPHHNNRQPQHQR